MSVLELFAVAGLRPYKILKLYQELGISSLAGLEAAAKEDRIRPVKGLGASLQTKILQNLAIARSGETQLHLHKAAALLEHAVESLKHDHPDYSRVEIAGDFRRGWELVSDLALVAQARRQRKPRAPVSSLLSATGSIWRKPSRRHAQQAKPSTNRT
jgi:DNA polymerase (family 10)